MLRELIHIFAEDTVPPESLVTPGPIGFAAIFVVVLATTLLILDVVRRIRRIRMRAEIQERLDAEETGQTAR